MPIRKLPPLLINQIAAGEVIERPASVVKELIENSLDAGATRIDVTVEEGGSRLIKISDDGEGITPDELPLAVSQHATSKIQTAEDLEAIATLGFRGEALASIASVSRLRITTRPTRDGVTAEAAARLEITGEQVSDITPASAGPGTVVEVRDLFFNTPARRKFMRTASTEFGHIHDLILRTAMVNAHVSFSLMHNDRRIRELPGTVDRRERCIDILGREIEEGLLTFELTEPAERGGTKIWGLAGQPKLARATTKFQYVYVNGRSVKDRNLQHAIKESYRGLMPPDKHPMAVVLIDMDPREVDVNVHPTKSEVRFRHPSRMHGGVLTAVRQCLLSHDLTPGTGDERAFSNNGFRFETNQEGSGSFATGDPKSQIQSSDLSGFVDYFKRMDSSQKGFVFQEVKKQLEAEEPALLQPDPDGHGPTSEDSPAAQAIQPLPAYQPTPLLQVRNSFVVTEDADGILIVDQHALHERVMFEELSQRILGDPKSSLESQRLLMPVIVDVSAKQVGRLDELQAMLERIGIDAQAIGPQQVAVHGFPTFLFNRHVDPGEFVLELLDKAEDGVFETEGGNALEEALHEVIDMMSCKAAVKAGDHMSHDELSALLAKRESVERSSNCPHGRPTTLRLTVKELEKRFGRI